MTVVAAPPEVGERRPASLGAALLVAAYVVLAPPLFLLGPLVLLLLFSKPSTAREGLWFGLAVLGSVLTLKGGGELPDQVLRAAGVFVTGAFVVLSIAVRRGVFFRAAWATVLGAAAVAVWSAVFRISAAEFERAVLHRMVSTFQAMLASQPGEAGSGPEVTAVLQAMIGSAPAVARVYPGIIALQALGGTALAWSWYHRIARRPIGAAPARFREFRFNDHLVWGAIFTLGLVLLPLGEPARTPVLNLLVVWVGLYWMRGLAVAVTLAGPWPALFKLLAVVFAVPLAPFALGTLLALGLADTWLDIRGRLTPSLRGGVER